MYIKSVLSAALLATSALTAAQVQPASAQVYIEIVEGIGFGKTQGQAYRSAIRAWIKQARVDYPNSAADFSSAIRSNISCSEDSASSYSGQVAPMGIGVDGPVDGNWSCSVRGLPIDILN